MLTAIINYVHGICYSWFTLDITRDIITYTGQYCNLISWPTFRPLCHGNPAQVITLNVHSAGAWQSGIQDYLLTNSPSHKCHTFEQKVHEGTLESTCLLTLEGAHIIYAHSTIMHGFINTRYTSKVRILNVVFTCLPPCLCLSWVSECNITEEWQYTWE